MTSLQTTRSRNHRTFALLAVLALMTVPLAGCMGDSGTGPGDGDGGGDPGQGSAQTASVTLLDPPATAVAGEAVTLRWRVDADPAATTDHTAVHWDTASHSGDDAAFGDYKGGLTPAQTGEVPGEFSAELTFDAPGTYYLRAHVMVGDQKNILSPEHALTVTAPDAGEPAVTLTEAPAEAQAGVEVTYRWRVDTPETTTIPHTAIHWDTVSHGGADAQFGDYGNLTPPHEGVEAPGDFQATLVFPRPGTYYLRAHAITDSDHMNVLSPEHTVTVTAPDAPNLVRLEAPTAAAVGEEVTIRWRVNAPAATTTAHTAVHYDNVSHPQGAYSDYGKISQVRSGDVPGEFTATLTPTSAGPWYYRLHAILDDTHYHSDEFMLEVT